MSDDKQQEKFQNDNKGPDLDELCNPAEASPEEMVVASKFKWSDLVNTEDWLAIWIGFIVIGLSVLSVVSGLFPDSGPFSYSAVRFADWGTPDLPSLSQILTPGLAVKWIFTFVFLAVLFGAGIKMMGHKVSSFVIGFGVLYLLSSLVFVLSAHERLSQYFEYAVWGLVIGLLISNTIGTPKSLVPALHTEYYIKTGLVIMGGEVLFSNIARFGGYGLAIAWFVTPTVIVFMWLFGRRLLHMRNPRMVIVIACATSVCGVSAAIAAAAASKAKKTELTFAIGLSLIFTILMMIFMPLIIRAVGMSTMVGGAWIGGTVDSTGAVVLAGEALGPIGGQVAALVKMIQNVLIGFIAFAVAIFFTTSVDRTPNTHVGPSEIWHRFPKFIIGFLVASLFSSFLLQPQLGIEATGTIIKTAATYKNWLFCLAFMSIGLESNFKEMAKQMAGGKPMILYAVGQSFNVILTLLIAWIALSGNFFPLPDLGTFID